MHSTKTRTWVLLFASFLVCGGLIGASVIFAAKRLIATPMVDGTRLDSSELEIIRESRKNPSTNAQAAVDGVTLTDYEIDVIRGLRREHGSNVAKRGQPSDRVVELIVAMEEKGPWDGKFHTSQD